MNGEMVATTEDRAHLVFFGRNQCCGLVDPDPYWLRVQVRNFVDSNSYSHTDMDPHMKI